MDRIQVIWQGDILDLYTAEAMSVLRDLRSHYSNPAYTPSEFVLDLTAKGMPKLAARARERRDFL